MSKKVSEFEISPLRSLDDFLLESARFQVPNIKDMDKWGNRVINNLLYYQTNYFLMSVLIFLIVGVLHPTKMACGMLVVVTGFLIFCYVTNERRAASRFKKDHPILGLVLILSGGYFITYMLGSLLVFFFGILLPFSVTFIHASLRLRNIKNKFVNKMEGIGLKRTPMGIFLEELGFEPEI
ncbi:Jwa [Carabus blaptoides fortunei]